MYDHIGLRVRDLARACGSTGPRSRALGHELSRAATPRARASAPRASTGLWLAHVRRDAGERGAHLAFRAANRAAVERFYKDGLAAGGSDNGAPGLRADYGPSYFAAFLVDPDGNNVEAVCLAQEK